MGLKGTTVSRLFKSGVILFIGSVFGTFGNFLSRTLTARVLPIEYYGAVALALSILTAFTTVILLGFNQGLGRFLPRYNQPSEQRAFILAALSTSVPIAITVGIVLVVFGPTIGSTITSNSMVGRIFQILGFALPFMVLTRIAIGTIQGLEQSLPKAYIQNFAIPISRILLLIVVLIFGVTLERVVFAYLLAIIIGAVGALYFLYQFAPLSGIGEIDIVDIGDKRRELLSFSIPLTITGMMSVMFSNIDTVMLGYFKGTAEIGMYDVAYLISKLLVLILSSFLFLFMPVFSRLHSENKEVQMRKIYSLITKWVFIIALPPLLLMIWYPETIIGLTFGQNYMSGTIILGILAIGFFSNVATGPNGNAMIALGKTRFIMAVNILIALVNIILNTILINRFSILGAAVATAISYALLNIIITIELFRETSIQPLDKSLSLLLIATLIEMHLINRVLGNLRLESQLLNIISAMSLLATYPVLVLMFSDFDDEEIALIKELEELSGINFTLFKKIYHWRWTR